MQITAAECALESATDPRPNDSVAVTFSFPWWLHPAWPASLFVTILPIASAPSVHSAFQIWGVPRYVDLGLAITGVLSGLAFIVGAIAAAGGPSYRNVRVVLSNRALRVLRTLALCMFVLALLGYLAWILLSFARGASPKDFLNVLALQDGAIGGLKRISPPVAGVTTLTQLGVVASTIMMFLQRIGSGRSYTGSILLLVFLALCRSFFYGERLAIIEIVIPLALLIIVVDRPNGSSRRRRFASRISIRIAPLLMLPLLWSVFALFEYSRSWLYYRNVVNTSFVEYISTRLLGYYTTTVNNGALYHQLVSSQHHDPYFSFAFLWDAPFVGSLLGRPEILGSSPRTWWSGTLANYANPEFNNEGTFLVTDADLGTALSILYWLLLGLVIGYAYARARQGDVRFLIAYCISFIGLLEISRINYWTQGRFIPILLGVMAILWCVKRPVPSERLHA